MGEKCSDRNKVQRRLWDSVREARGQVPGILGHKVSSLMDRSKSTLRFLGLKARACLRPEPFDRTQGLEPVERLRSRGSGLTLSGASLPRLKTRGLPPPNGSNKSNHSSLLYQASPCENYLIDKILELVILECIQLFIYLCLK